MVVESKETDAREVSIAVQVAMDFKWREKTLHRGIRLTTNPTFPGTSTELGEGAHVGRVTEVICKPEARVVNVERRGAIFPAGALSAQVDIIG